MMARLVATATLSGNSRPQQHRYALNAELRVLLLLFAGIGITTVEQAHQIAQRNKPLPADRYAAFVRCAKNCVLEFEGIGITTPRRSHQDLRE